MSKHEPIIDIDPVAAARDKARSTAEGGFQAPSFGKKDAVGTAKESARNVAQATVAGSSPQTKKPSRLGGAVQTAVGGAVMLVGVPMLILPGPGLVAIGGGAALAAGGIKKMLGK